ERARFQQHLIKGVVPAQAKRFPEAHVVAGDAAEARIQVGVSALEKGQQAAGGDTARDGIAAGGFDRRQIGGSERNWAGKHGKKEKRSNAASHGLPTLSSPCAPWFARRTRFSDSVDRPLTLRAG